MDSIFPNDPLFAQQWYLNNTGQSGGIVGADINVLDAWQIATGDGVVIGVVDGGLQHTHPDLNSQYLGDLSFDFADNDSDPDPSDVSIRDLGLLVEALARGEEIDFRSIFDFLEQPTDLHGTPVAGIAAASGNNQIGVTGVAYNASLAGLRIQLDDELDEDDLDTQLAEALSHQNQDIDIYNNSWQLGLPLIPLGDLTTTAIEDSIAEGRDGLGNIYVFAAGNDGQEGGNVNYNAFANSRYTIAVGALDQNGVKPSYSNPGASLLISAYVGSDNQGIITTDLQGEDGLNLSLSPFSILDDDYTEFLGTSAATPIVSGVVALMLEANPNLTWRDVQHIIVETAVQNDPGNPDWIENGAGYLVNHNYGFGAIDSTAAVTVAQNWQTVAPEVSISSEVINVNTNIPDNNLNGITSTVSIADDIEIEWVEIIADADLIQEDLEVILTSPDGTRSILAQQGSGSNISNSWTFTSARHWGESSAGEWSLTVIDSENSAFFETTWDSWQLNFYGTTNTMETDISLNNSEIIDNLRSRIQSLIGLTNSNNPTNNIEDLISSIRNEIQSSFDDILDNFPNVEDNTIIVNENNLVIPNFVDNPLFSDVIDSNRIINIDNEDLNLTDFILNDDIVVQVDNSLVISIESQGINTPMPTIDDLNLSFDLNLSTDVEIMLGDTNNNPTETNLVYRFFNNQLGVHFYTASEAEKQNVIDNLTGFSFEGASYLAVDPLTGLGEPAPVYRFQNIDTGLHLYTISEDERNFIQNNLANYVFEGEVFSAYTSAVEGTIPIYRFFNSTLGTHFYTPSADEKELVEQTLSNYIFEGIAYYALPTEDI